MELTFEEAEIFWTDINGIMELLNNANNRYEIIKPDSPMITNYLLWRILNELKIQNVNKELPK